MCCGKSKVSNSNWLKFLHSQVGDKAVGMTSLLYSYKNNQFPNGDWKPKPSLMDTYSINGMNKLATRSNNRRADWISHTLDNMGN